MKKEKLISLLLLITLLVIGASAYLYLKLKEGNSQILYKKPQDRSVYVIDSVRKDTEKDKVNIIDPILGNRYLCDKDRVEEISSSLELLKEEEDQLNIDLDSILDEYGETFKRCQDKCIENGDKINEICTEEQCYNEACINGQIDCLDSGKESTNDCFESCKKAFDRVSEVQDRMTEQGFQKLEILGKSVYSLIEDYCTTE